MAEEILILNANRWILEVYRTIIGTLQGVAWLLLIFFILALIDLKDNSSFHEFLSEVEFSTVFNCVLSTKIIIVDGGSEILSTSVLHGTSVRNGK